MASGDGTGQIGSRGHPRLTFTGHQWRVLLAEDDGEMRALLAEALRDDGYDVLEFRDGAALAAFLREGPGRRPLKAPTVVVTDLMMRGGSGLGAVAELGRRGLQMPAVLLTDFGNGGTWRSMDGLVSACVLEKPFDMDELCHVLHRLTA